MIDPDFQIKQRNRAPSKGFTFDYRALWEEAGGQCEGSEHWDLPLASPERAVADIPSNKRSMYTRRYALRRQRAQQDMIAWASIAPYPGRALWSDDR